VEEWPRMRHLLSPLVSPLLPPHGLLRFPPAIPSQRCTDPSFWGPAAASFRPPPAVVIRVVILLFSLFLPSPAFYRPQCSLPGDPSTRILLSFDLLRFIPSCFSVPALQKRHSRLPVTPTGQFLFSDSLKFFLTSPLFFSSLF